MNKVILIGNLGQDPESKTTGGGLVVSNFTLATSDRAKDANGQWVNAPEWHRCVAFGKTAEMLVQYKKKGDTISVVGKVKTRKWQDKDGNDRYSTEILVDDLEFVGAPRQGAGSSTPSSYADNKADDDIPF